MIVIPDNDDAGREHADEVPRSLAGKAARIRLLDLPGLPDKGDVSDWFAAGGRVEAFNALVDQAARLDRQRHATDYRNSATQRDILPGTDYADMSTVSRKRWLVHHLARRRRTLGVLWRARFGQVGAGARTSACMSRPAGRGSAER